MKKEAVCPNFHRRRRAFTLVELLVVISIIALLLSILMPVLGKAREQAMVVTCTANCKQMSTVIAAYQTENNGCVPVVLYKYGTGLAPPASAKRCLMSLAFWGYTGKAAPLPSDLDPTTVWNDLSPSEWGYPADNKYMRYIKNYLPKFYVCPFGRGEKTFEWVSNGTKTLSGPNGTRKYRLSERRGSDECFTVSLYAFNANDDLNDYADNGDIHPYGLPHGRPKYAALTWFGYEFWMDGPKNGPSTDKYSKYKPARWTDATARSQNASGLSQCTVLICDRGERMNFRLSIQNYGSHRKGRIGGTNAIFGDLHCEWVRGSQIGWQ